MSGLPADLRWLKQRTLALAAGLQARLSEYVGDYPADTPVAFIELLKRLLETLDRRVSASSDSRFLATAQQLIFTLSARFLPIFDNAHTEQTPRALVSLLENLAQRIEPDTRSIVWPQASYNFSISRVLPLLREAVDALLSEQEKDYVFAGFQGHLNIVSFPRIDRDNVLMDAVFGHELGHPIADEFLAQERTNIKFATRLKQIQQQLPKLFAAEFAIHKQPLQRLSLERKLTQAILEVRRRGLQELISDQVSVFLFGPSALFAGYDVFIGTALDALPTSAHSFYPPTRLRLRTMLLACNRGGYIEKIRQQSDGGVRRAADEFLSNLEQIVNSQDDVTTLNGDAICRTAYDWLRDSLNEAEEFAIARLNDCVFDCQSIERELPDLLRRIEFWIPPNETGSYPFTTTVDWRSSILAGWLFKIKRMHEAEEIGDPFGMEENDRLQRLVMNAIESALLAKRHEAYRRTREHTA